MDWYFDSAISRDVVSISFIMAVVYMALFVLSFRFVASVLANNELAHGTELNVGLSGALSTKRNKVCKKPSKVRSDPIELAPTHQMYVTSYFLATAVGITVLVVPITIVTMRLLFANDVLGVMEHCGWKIWMALSFSTLGYMGEVSLKSGARRSWQMLTHHALTMLLSTTTFLSGSVFLLKLGAILQTFNLWEFPLFWAFFANRLPERTLSSKTLHRWILPVCTAIYVVTRVVQFGLLTALFACGPRSFSVYSDVEYAILFVVTLVLVGLQLLLVTGLRHLSKSTAPGRRKFAKRASIHGSVLKQHAGLASADAEIRSEKVCVNPTTALTAV
jgi:hypothetical protein